MSRSHIWRCGVIAVSVLAAGTEAATAATTTHLAAQRVDSDSFDNYDFSTPNVSSYNVDWPVTLLFRNNAEVDKVKSALANNFPVFGSPAYGRIDNSFGWFYDSDRGRKGQVCPIADSTTHYRLYADGDHGDRNYSPGLGYYVLGTTHSDVNECGGGTTIAGYSEGAENNVAASGAAQTNWKIYNDIYDMRNEEPSRMEGNHYWSNGGTATQFDVD